jgi:hypothetical protein
MAGRNIDRRFIISPREADSGSENHIIILMLSKHVHRICSILLASILLLLLLAICFDLSISRRLVSLLLVGNLLQPIEFLSIQFVKLGVDV